MHLMQKKGNLSIRGHTVLCVLLGLLLSEVSAQDANSAEGELSFLKLKIKSIMNRYKLLCNQYSNLALNCSAPAINCTECPAGWIQVEDQCFHLTSDTHDWFNSSLKCKEIGGHLAILTTDEQHDTVKEEARRIGGFNTYYWIGLSDIENEGDWKWVDNSTLKVPFWNTWNSEPDNNQSGGEHGEDCVVVDSYTKSWYDVPCSFSYRQICQMDAIPLI